MINFLTNMASDFAKRQQNANQGFPSMPSDPSGQGLIGQMAQPNQPMMTPQLFEQNRQEAFNQLNPQQQQWMGYADATDPAIRARMPQPPAQPATQSDVLDPRDVNYKSPTPPAGRSGGGGGGVSAAQAPGLSMGGGSVGGGGTQYAGGIPVILRSYGEPSTGLLKYIEG